jgi:hypothetical protein
MTPFSPTPNGLRKEVKIRLSECARSLFWSLAFHRDGAQQNVNAFR